MSSKPPSTPAAEPIGVLNSSSAHGAGLRSEGQSAAAGRSGADDPATARFTIFTIPKPFVGDAERIQLNAIRSWARLAPQVDILLLGDEAGVANVASTVGQGRIRHVSELRRNSVGTPLLDAAFEIAAEVARTPLLMYCNCDVIFSEDLVRAVEALDALMNGAFVGFGRRTDLQVDQLINFEDPREIQQLEQRIEKSGRPESIVCKEYFIFRKGSYDRIPAFAVGRGNWDNWMIRNAKDRGLPAIDLSPMVTAVHQTHDYAHAGRNRWQCYVSGPEAKENQRLAGGRGLIRGSTPTWRLERAGLRPVRGAVIGLPFWRDLPRFAWFLKNLVVG